MKKYFINVLKSFQDNLQEYVLKNGGLHLKNSKSSCPELNNAIHGQTNGTLLCPPRSNKTFIENIFPYFLYFTRCFDAKVKITSYIYIATALTSVVQLHRDYTSGSVFYISLYFNIREPKVGRQARACHS